MSTPKGYSSRQKPQRINAEHANVEPARPNQFGLSIVGHLFAYQVGTDAVEANSTTEQIVATGHSAKIGDIIRFTSGALSGVEVKVWSISANAIDLAEDLESAPSALDTFEILRHKYPKVDSDGALSLTTGPIKFNLDGVETEVNEDTATPSNNAPLPVKITSATGDINITAGDLNVQLSHTGASYDSTRIGDGTTLLGITLNNEAKVSDADSQSLLTAISGKLPSTLGQKAMAASLAVVLASDQSAIPASQSGTWNITNISGTVSLPTGAATESTLAAVSAKLPDSLGKKAAAASLSVTLATSEDVASQTTLAAALAELETIDVNTDINREQLSSIDGKLPAAPGQTTMAGSLAVVLASDQSAIPASQSGNWSVRAQDGSGNALTSAVVGSARGLNTKPLGSSAVGKARNDYSSANVSTAAYTQLVASLAAECHEIEIFDSSGQTLVLATGAAASESDQIYIIPGGNGRIPLRIAAGTRVSIKAVSGAANSGEIDVNFYG